MIKGVSTCRGAGQDFREVSPSDILSTSFGTHRFLTSVQSERISNFSPPVAMFEISRDIYGVSSKLGHHEKSEPDIFAKYRLHGM